MFRRFFVFLFGIIMGVVLTVGGVGYGVYYVANNYTVNRVEQDFGVRVPITDDAEIRDKTIMEIVELVASYGENPDAVTIADVISAFGIGELLPESIPVGDSALDMREIYALTLSEFTTNPVDAVLNTITLGVVMDLTGMDATVLPFLSEMRDKPVVTAFNSLDTLPVGEIAGIGPDGQAIVRSLLYPEDDTGSYVEWTAPSGNRYYVDINSFNVDDTTVKYFRVLEGETYVYKRVLESDVISPETDLYVSVRGEYVTEAQAQDYATSLASAKRYRAMTIAGGFNLDLNGIYLTDVIDPTGNHLMETICYKVYDPATDSGEVIYKKVDGAYTEAEEGYDGKSYVRVSIGELNGDLFNDILDTLTIADVMQITGGEDAILAKIAFNKVPKTDPTYDPQKEYYGVDERGAFKPISEITGDFLDKDYVYEAVTIGDLQDKVSNLSIKDVLPAPDENSNGFYIKLYDSDMTLSNLDVEGLIDSLYVSDVITIDADTESVLVALSFTLCEDETTCSICQSIPVGEEKVYFGIIDGTYDSKTYNGRYMEKGRIEEITDAEYTGALYHPTKIMEIAGQVDSIKLGDVLPAPDADSPRIYVKLYENERDTLISELDSAFSRIIDDIAIADVMESGISTSDPKILRMMAFEKCALSTTCEHYDDHYGIDTDGYYKLISEIAGTYEGDHYHALGVRDISSKISNVAIVDVLDETITTDSAKVMQTLAFKKCTVSGCTETHYGIDTDHVYKPVSEIAGTYTGGLYHAQGIDDISTTITNLTLQDVLDEPQPTDHAILRKLYEKNPSINGMSTAINEILPEVNVAEVIDVPVDNKILRAIAYKNTKCTIVGCSTEPRYTRAADGTFYLVAPGVEVDEPVYHCDDSCTEQHYRIDGETNQFVECDANYLGERYHAVSVSEMSVRVTELHLSDVLPEPPANDRSIYSKLYYDGHKLSDLDASVITSLVDETYICDTLHITADSEATLKSIAFEECKNPDHTTCEFHNYDNGVLVNTVTYNRDGHYGVAFDGSFRPISEIEEMEGAYTGKYYRPIMISEVQYRATNLTVSDMLGEPEYGYFVCNDSHCTEPHYEKVGESYVPITDPSYTGVKYCKHKVGIFAIMGEDTKMSKLTNELQNSLKADSLTIKQLEYITGEEIADQPELEIMTISQLIALLQDNWLIISGLIGS